MRDFVKELTGGFHNLACVCLIMSLGGLLGCPYSAEEIAAAKAAVIGDCEEEEYVAGQPQFGYGCSNFGTGCDRDESSGTCKTMKYVGNNTGSSQVRYCACDI